MKIILVVILVSQSYSFLLEGSTSGSQMSLDDKRYNTLMNLLMEERRSRLTLEEAVSRELLALKQEVAKCQCQSRIQNESSSNKEGTDNSLSNLAVDISTLKKDNELIRDKVANLTELNSDVNNKIKQLEQNFSSNQQLPNVTYANYLAEEIRTTQNNLNSIENDVNARKQDFIALYQKVLATEQQIDNVTKLINVRQNQTFNNIQQQMDLIRQHEGNMSSKLDVIEMRQRNISYLLRGMETTIKQSIDNNAVALTTCKKDKSVNHVVQFTDIQIVNGINNTESIRQSGIFTCEKSGLYVISVFLQTYILHSRFDIKKNNASIAAGYTSITDYHQTTSVTIVSNLSPRDTISVAGSFFINPGFQSCLTIFQINS